LSDTGSVVRWLVLLTLAACGRVNFDARGDGGTAPGDSTAMADALTIAGLVAWWPLGDDFVNATTALDVSGNNLHATCTSCPSRAQGRSFGFAARFDGVSDLLLRAADPRLDLPTFTAAAWVRLERRAGIVEILVSRAFGIVGENSFALTHTSMGRPEFYSQGNTSLQGPTQVPLDTWLHFALTFDGTTKGLFVDGVSQGQMLAGPPVTYDNNPLTIGGDIENSVPGFFLQGTLSDVMLFDRELTAGEIQQLALP
jgi:Concanavalin A-like lectin/glucanases superfamily